MKLRPGVIPFVLALLPCIGMGILVATMPLRLG
jgi:hypothetical protein